MSKTSHVRTGPALWCCILFFLAAVLVSGCDRKSRYQVMTTVFTGVPPYEEFYADKPEKDDAPVEIDEGPRVYTHPVYEERMCTSCHKNVAPRKENPNLSGREDFASEPSAPPPDLILPVEKLCTSSCHIDKTPRRAIRENLWLHNPVARGRCSDCHNPHQSTNPFQLKLPVGQLCVSCHASEKLTPESHLDTIGDKTELAMKCRTCHTNHMGRDKQLLVSDYTEVKRPVMMPAR